MKIDAITLNKNRGWRGLAELRCMAEGKVVSTTIFSFSQDVWDDMQMGKIVTEDGDNYVVITFEGTERLPKGQRSVLIKDFHAKVESVAAYNKKDWWDKAPERGHYMTIMDYKRNSNRHTTSNWNCIGIRVMP